MEFEMERITSKDNEKIKWLIKLQNSRKVRQESASFVARGCAWRRRCCAVVCRCSRFSPAMTVPHDIASVWNALCQKASAAYLISDGLEAKISSVQTPQGIYCVCGMPRHTFGQIAGFGEKFLRWIICRIREIWGRSSERRTHLARTAFF